MAKKEKIEKENLSEIMNLIRAEEVMCYDKETGKCILLENLEAISQQEEGKVWIFPYDMELCSKEKGLRWFIEEYNIVSVGNTYVNQAGIKRFTSIFLICVLMQ